MTVVEGGNRLYWTEPSYSIIGKYDHVQSMSPKFGQ